MGSVIDRRGQKFGRLTPIRIVGKDKKGHALWECQCDCGNIATVASDNLVKGNTRSCGCLNRESLKSGNNRRTHGGVGTRLYRIWGAMRRRCYNPNTPDYKTYKDISVCDEWRKDFGNFRKWALENGYNDSLSIDRIDPLGDYCPQNCRWADAVTQANNKTTTRMVTVNGVQYNLKDACEKFGIGRHLFYQRIKKGMSEEEAFLMPRRERVS